MAGALLSCPRLDLAHAETLLRNLETHADRVQLHYGELQGLIQECMDVVYELAKTADDDDRKMRLVAVEHRAGVPLERWRRLKANRRMRRRRAL